MGEHPVHVFTDHKNLLYIFAPTAFDSTLGKHVISKVHRWAMFLSRFDFVIEHIDGELNVFADILTRWLKGYKKNFASTHHICALSHASEQLIPSLDAVLLPSMEEIKAKQTEHENPENYTLGENDMVMLSGRIWIPNDDELKLRILVGSHCGINGYRGAQATESIVKESFHWDGMSSDIESFVKSCMHCLVTRNGDIIPRPLSSALHGSRPN